MIVFANFGGDMRRSIFLPILSLVISQHAFADLKAQYEPVSAVLLSSGANQMDHYHRQTTPELLEDGTYLEEFRAVEEVAGIFESISIFGAPTVLMATDAIPYRLESYMKVPKSEFVLANERFAGLVANKSMTVVSMPKSIIDDPQYSRDESRLLPDRWIRDWGPFNIGGNFVGNEVQRRGNLANPIFARQFKMPLKNSNFFPVGGTFMKTSDGVCSVSVVSDPMRKDILGIDAIDLSELTGERAAFLQNDLGCKRVIGLEPLPLEPLGHLDLFVKFLSDKKVAVARYEGDMVQVRAIRKIKSTECFPPATSGPCDQTYHRDFYSGSISDVEATDIDFKDMNDYLLSRHPGIEIELAELWGALGPAKPINLKQFSDHLVTQFKNEGFDVIEIPQPQPVVTVTVVQHMKEDRTVVVDKVRARIVFPTYLNSLLINGTAFIPSYNYWANDELNRRAFDHYRSAGFNVQSLPSDFTILEGGTIHCVTKEIH